MSNIFKTNSRSYEEYDEFKRDKKNNFIENRYNRRQNDNEVRKRREKQEIEYNNNYQNDLFIYGKRMTKF